MEEEKEKAGTAVDTAAADKKTVATSTPGLGRGHEDAMESSDFEIPRMKIVQFTSQEAQAEKKEDRVEPGTLISSLSKNEIPPEFIPIFRYKTYTQWNPLKKDDPNYDPAYEPGDMVFSTKDRHDPRVVAGIEFGPKGETPKVTQAINFFCYVPGQKLPMILSFQKTSFKGGKKLNSLLDEAGGDMFANKFRLIFTIEQKASNKYYVMDVRGNGKASPEEFAACEAIYNRFRGKDIDAMAHKEEGPKTQEWQD